jgi:hypothetical protein
MLVHDLSGITVRSGTPNRGRTSQPCVDLYTVVGPVLLLPALTLASARGRGARVDGPTDGRPTAVVKT